jgi:hypothetical protein
MLQPPFDVREIIIIAVVMLAVGVAIFAFLFLGPRKPKD